MPSDSDRLRPPSVHQPIPPAAHVQILQGWSGPLPPPEVLESFERVHPGSAEIIVSEFVKEAAHRRSQERREGSLLFFESVGGRITALLFGLSCLGVSAFAVYEHAYWIAGILGGTVIVAGMAALARGGSRSAE